MPAKEELLIRLKYLDGAVNLGNLVDNGLAENDHNGVANLLRKGLGIVAFNILEDFIKMKAGEALQQLSNSGIIFSNLSEDLQRLSTFGALGSLQFRSELLRKESETDSIALIQSEAFNIHSTSLHPFQLSSLSLVSSGSNIYDNEVNLMLKSFGISGGWNALKNLSDSIGGGIPDLAQAYKNAAKRRNKCAHSANYYYDYLWLSGLKNEIIAIAASIDILLTARCRQVERFPEVKLTSHDIQSALNFRFLEKRGREYKETRRIAGISRKNWLNITDAIEYLQPKLVRRNEFLIILNDSRRIETWYT